MGRINLDNFSIADTSEQKESNITITNSIPSTSAYSQREVAVTYIHNGRGYQTVMANSGYEHPEILNIKASLVIFEYSVQSLIGYGCTGGMCFQLNDFNGIKQIIFIPFADDATIIVEEQGE